ncbi:hypothetical protein ACIBG5_32620 [Kribbella sp. NPDC050241]|uniref:hypothetical protein n=1 Tax=Kribbella sp. NPDC050241 TaxID=3364115 RepID=UPI0037BC7B68
MNWPISELDDVRRLRALHAALPGTLLSETVVPADFDRIWAELSDLEHSFLNYTPSITSIQITERNGERMRAQVRDRIGLRALFEVVLRSGWCLMQSRYVVFGMAAARTGEGTRVGYLLGLRLPGMRLYGRLLTPLLQPIGGSIMRGFSRRWTEHHE